MKKRERHKMKTRRNRIGLYKKTVEIIFQHFIPFLTQISKNHRKKRDEERKKTQAKAGNRKKKKEGFIHFFTSLLLVY
jgi:hypothetical protein